jgi:hypothetical protein
LDPKLIPSGILKNRCPMKNTEHFCFREIHLLAQWRRLPEGVLVDRDGYSDLAPGQASRWSLQVRLAPPTLGLLSKSLGRLLNLCNSSSTLRQLLGDVVMRSPDEGISLSLPNLNVNLIFFSL